MFFKNTFLVLLIGWLCLVSCDDNYHRKARSKKKVVIIGEMSDLAFGDLTANSSNHNYALNDVVFEDYDDFTERTRKRPIRAFTKRTGYSPSNVIQPPNGGGSVFVPVAAYSVTHSRVNNNGLRRRGPGKWLMQLLQRRAYTNLHAC